MMTVMMEWSFYMKGWLALQSRSRPLPTASRNRNKFCVPDEVRDMASEAAKCRNPVRKKELRKIARKARRDFEAGRAVLPCGKSDPQAGGHETLDQRAFQRV